MIEPYDWQLPAIERGVEVLSEHNFLHNASGTGTGKTVCSLQVCKELGLVPLVVCPKSVITAWCETAKDMGVPLYGVVNPQRLLYKNPYYNTKTRWSLPPSVNCVIDDEVHLHASGESSKSGKAIAELKAYPHLKTMTLSATLADSPLKLRTVGFLAGLHDYNKTSWIKFQLAHNCFLRPGTRSMMFSKFGAKSKIAINNIAASLRPYLVRIDSDTVPGFPKSLNTAKLFDLDSVAEAEFNRIMAEMDAALKVTGNPNPLVEALRYRQRTELLKTPILLDCVIEALEEGLAPVVFVQFRDTLEELQTQLMARGISCSRIIGGQAREIRDLELKTFQEDKTDCMLATAAAGGVGISLHALKGSKIRNRTSFISPGYSASDLVQALGRIQRANGRNVVQTIVLCAHTIEQKIYSNLQGKLARINTINDADLLAPEKGET